MPMTNRKRWDAVRRDAPTPITIPVVNLMTGPPGLGRNGGVWRHIKRYMLRREHVPALMTHAFHFLEFELSAEAYANWRGGPSGRPGFRGWLEEYCSPFDPPGLFIDSGGFQLMSGPAPDLAKYGVRLNATGILELQASLGADAVASLDFPIGRGISQDEAGRRMAMSLRNCTLLLRRLNEGTHRFFPYLCIHGLDRKSAYLFTSKVLRAARLLRYNAGDFGLAIGSLVPIRNHSSLVFEIIEGVRDGLKEASEGFLDQTPLHVFGVSGSLVPFLYAFGVSSFDSSAYAQAATNLRYITSFPFGQVSFDGLSQLTCDCWYCRRIESGGVQRSKRILKSRPYRTYDFGGRSVTKSELYAMVAMHNWTSLTNGLKELAELHDKELAAHIISMCKSSLQGRRLLAASVKTRPDWKAVLPDGLNLPALHQGPSKYPDITPRLNSKDFDLRRYDFRPEGNALLLLACTATKPYNLSRSHRFVYRGLSQTERPLRGVDIVSVSGLYGPVPRDYETARQVLQYNFRLTASQTRQKRIVTERLCQFLRRFQNDYRITVSYVSSPVYRSVIRDASHKAEGDVVILPREPGWRNFYDERSISELATLLSGSST